MFGKRAIMIILLGLMVSFIQVKASDIPWKIVINIPEYRLYLFNNGELYKSYNVAVGKIDSPSPIGEFAIVNKLINPTWYPEGRIIPPGPNNPLGKYWMGLNIKGYGIHGNVAPWSIGTPASKGCFRMDNNDIEDLFSLVPIGTTVKINYETVKGFRDVENQVWVEIYQDIYNWCNLGKKIQQVLAGLGWEYQIHQKALAILTTARNPLMMIPRKIDIKCDFYDKDPDGFYWNGRIYLNRNYFKESKSSTEAEGLFLEYLSWDLKAITGGARKDLKWDQTLNTLTVYNLKVMLNNERIDGAGGVTSQGDLLINYFKICNWLKLKELTKPDFQITTGVCALLGDDCNVDEYWIEPKKLTEGRNGFSYYFDEESFTIFLYYNPG